MNSVCLSYSAVHEIFQLALAAHEVGELDGLFCTMIDLPGKFGQRLSRLASVASARPLGYDQLPADRVTECPWPVVVHRTLMRLMPWRRRRHLWSNAWFDFHASRWVRRRNARIFVGGETCSIRSLHEAKRKGMITVLDCPGMPSEFLDRNSRKAAAEFGIASAPGIDHAMQRRKRAEVALADVILSCSELHKAMIVNEGIAPAEKVHAIPLWTDVDYWSSRPRQPFTTPGEKLRVLYAGAVSLRKGVPYLLRAMDDLKDAASLTMAGGVSTEMAAMLAATSGHTHFPYLSKDRLREQFLSQDVLVMPSLGDSFGFVALEAMAAGLPVIVTSNCGVPVPDESWRVPACDSSAIVHRLHHYIADRGALAADSQTAAAFAALYRPERYRREAGALFQGLLKNQQPGG